VKIYVTFFFSEPTVTGISYLNILENYFLPQIEQDMDSDLIFQQDGASPRTSIASLLSAATGRCLLGLDVMER
jgi:hypothetical protein